eukprot:scaffold39466_cov62-Phaeocystis_antarctica.AAC.5
MPISARRIGSSLSNLASRNRCAARTSVRSRSSARTSPLFLDAHEHALWVELLCRDNLAEVGLLLALLEVGQAEGHLDNLVEVLEAADARVAEDRLRHAAAKQAL